MRLTVNDGSCVFFKLMASSSEYDANDFESLPKLVGRLPEELFSLFKGAADETYRCTYCKLIAVYIVG